MQSGNLKPQSVHGLEPVTWEIATIAHVSEPVQLMWLADYGGLQQFLAVEMAYGVDATVSDFFLNGGFSENGTEQPGILTTTGIQQTFFVTNNCCPSAGRWPNWKPRVWPRPVLS